ncbi:MAG: hypothetical protein ACRDTH_16915 [Pseudonocardiaceae bacterium]
MSQEQAERSSPVALFVARTRRFRLWRTVSGLSMIGGLLLAGVVVGQRWLGLLGIVIYALGSVLVVGDMARHVRQAHRPDPPAPAGNRRHAILARLGWFLLGVALIAGGSIIAVAA